MTYMAIVKNKKNKPCCGASLISGIHALTVANCIARYKEILIPRYNGIYVVAGTHSITEKGIERNIKHLDYYEHFYRHNNTHIFGDIGLLTVSNT